MLPAIPPHRVPRRGGPPADDRRQRRGQDPRQPRRRPVGHVVQPRAPPPESGPGRRPVPDHRVQRIDSPVPGQAGQTGQHPPYQRRDHRVAGVLGDRLHHGPGQLTLVERAGITPAQARQGPPCRRKVAGLERRCYPLCFAGQGARPGHGPYRGGRHGQAQPGPAAGQVLRQHRGRGGAQHAAGRVPRAAQPAVRVGPLQRGLRGPAEQCDRVPAPRIAEQRISGHARDDPGGGRPAG